MTRMALLGLGLLVLAGCGKNVGPFTIPSMGNDDQQATTDQQAQPKDQGATQAQNKPTVESTIPKRSVRYDADVLMGASLKAVETSLGAPDIIFADKNVQFLRYDGPGCAVHILMEADKVIEVTPRARNGRPLQAELADDCFHEMVKARRNHNH